MNIYAWGYGQQIWEMLNSVKFFVGNDAYMVPVAIAAMLFMGVIRFINTGTVDWKMFLVSMLVVTAFLRPGSRNFHIIDEATGYGQTISGIPLGLGLFLSLESQLEKAMLQKTESSFSTPNSVSLQNAGMGFSLIAPLEMMNARPADRYTQLTFNHWMNNCFLYDIAQGHTNLNTIANTKDLLSNLAPTVRYETLVFSSANPDGVEEDCMTAYNTIAINMGNEANFYMNTVLPAKMNMSGSANFNGALNGSQALLKQASANAQKWIEQEMMRNVLDEGFRATAALNGGELVGSAWSAAVAKATTNQTWRMAGQQAKNNLPVVRAVGTSMLVGASVIVAFYAVASMSFKALFMLLAGFITLGLWSPIASIINYQVYRRAENAMDTFNGGFGSMANANIGLEQISTYAANLEWWYGAIPMISYMLITGGGMGAMYLMRDAAAGSGAGAGAGLGVSKGDISQGNVQLNTGAYNEERANHQSYVNEHGSHNNIDTLSGTSSTRTGTDGNGGGYLAQTTSIAGGGGNIQVQNAAGKSNVSYSNTGDIVDSSWNNPSLSNMIADRSTASLTKASNTLDQSTKAFSRDLSHMVTEAGTHGVDLKDSQQLSDFFGVSAQTGKTTSDMVEKAETKALMDSVGTKENAEISKKFGNEWKTRLGANLNFLPIVDAAGQVEGYQVNDQKTGESYTHEFKGSEGENYKKAFTENLTRSLNSDNGVRADFANSITEGKTHVDGETKADTKKYNEAVSHYESVSQNADRIRTQAKENGANLNGQLLKEYIENDPTLNRKWHNAKNNNQRENLISTAQQQIQHATMDPSNHPHEYQNVQKELDNISQRYGHQDVFQTAEQKFNSYDGGSTQEIKTGHDEVVAEKIEDINKDAESLRLNTDAGEKMQTVYNNQDPHKPNIEQHEIKNPNFVKGTRKEDDITGIVMHSTAGHNLTYDRAEKDGYGTHYWVDKDGSIYQTANDNEVVYHTGKTKPGHEDGKSQNTIGIEVVQGYDEKTGQWEQLTPQQEESIGQLTRYISDKYDIGADHMYAHGEQDKYYKTAGEGEEALKIAKSNDMTGSNFDNTHKAMKKFVTEQSLRAGRESDSAGNPGEGYHAPDKGELYAGNHNAKKAWELLEENNMIQQKGWVGSSWEPTKDFDANIEKIDTESIKRVLTLNESSSFAYNMTSELKDMFENEISKRALEEVRQGNHENIKYLQTSDSEKIKNKKG